MKCDFLFACSLYVYKSTWVLIQLYDFHPIHRAHIMQCMLYTNGLESVGTPITV